MVQLPSTNNRRVNPDFLILQSFQKYLGHYTFTWQNKMLFAVPRVDKVDKWAHVTVPDNHVTFISLPFFCLSRAPWEPTKLQLSAYSHSNSTVLPTQRWIFTAAGRIDLPQVVKAALLTVHMRGQYIRRTDAFIMAFSFIEVNGCKFDIFYFSL